MALVVLLAVATGVLAGPAGAHDAGTRDPGPRRVGAPAAATVAGWRDRAERLTLDLAVEIGRDGDARRSDPGRTARLERLAARRQRLLAALAEDDPAAVLRVAVPESARARLPAGVRRLVERRVELDGVLEVLHEDYANGAGRYRYFLRLGDRRLSLHFAGRRPALQTDTPVRARGVQVGTALVVESGEADLRAYSPVLPGTLGDQHTLVILVNFQDAPAQPYTPAHAEAVVFGTTSDWDLENSFQRTWLTGQVVGWYTISLGSTGCDHLGIAGAARLAAQAHGVNLNAYSRFVYAFPENACDWWGLGTVGGSPSHAWVNGTFALRVVGHELGHNFGLYHSHALECGTVVAGTACTNLEYGDTLDIMGSSAGHFTAFQKELLGWLGAGGAPPITTVLASGTYAVERYESPGASAKALRVPKAIDPATGARTWYYVEYRQAHGYDGFLAGNGNVLNGVVLHTGTEGDGDSSYLLDLTPATSSWTDPGLVFGQSYHDPAAGVTIAPLSGNGQSALVRVTFDAGPTCTPAAPLLTLLPPQSPWVPAGTPVAYAVAVQNRDSAACPATTFALAATLPGAWSGILDTPSVALGPGATGAATLTVTSPAIAAAGFYPVVAGATHPAAPALSGAATATYVVAGAVGLTVSTDRARYRRGQTATVTAVVTSVGGPVAGVPVAFTLTGPTGGQLTAARVTGGTGRAVAAFRIARGDPSGAYQVEATVTLSGTVAAQGGATFVVSNTIAAR